MKILLTGGCGFIGHHFVQHVMKTTNHKLVILDKLNYSCQGFERLRDLNYLNSDRIQIFTVDLIRPLSKGVALEIGSDVDVIVHMSAETHVDNSIADPVFVIQNNVDSTLHILEYARQLKALKCFFYFSTDEVFGPALGTKAFKETDRHNPTNPYSASKSAGEQLCVAYQNTYKLPIMIVNVMNAMGERQHVEKFIPKCIKSILQGKKIYIHTDKNKIAGSRSYIHARNIASAVMFLIEKGKIGENYNIGGEQEVNNLEMAQMIASVLQKELDYELVDFHSDRPGHDLRYGLDGTKLSQLGWTPPVGFMDSLRKTVEWTVQNPKWLEH
jgi:dTDP-glucose 4,6-dehydratase